MINVDSKSKIIHEIVIKVAHSGGARQYTFSIEAPSLDDAYGILIMDLEAIIKEIK